MKEKTKPLIAFIKKLIILNPNSENVLVSKIYPMFFFLFKKFQSWVQKKTQNVFCINNFLPFFYFNIVKQNFTYRYTWIASIQKSHV